MGIFNTIMLAATPLLPQDITPYNYKTIESLSPTCWRIDYSIDNAYPNPIEFLTIKNTKKFTAVFYCKENFSQTQEEDNRVEVSESNLFFFGAESNFWKSLLELNDESANNFYSIVCDSQIEFSVVIQEQRLDNYQNGYDIGYKKGYDAAVKDTTEGSYNWITSAFNTLKTIFEIELIPNFKLGYLIGIPFVITLVAFIISWFR